MKVSVHEIIYEVYVLERFFGAAKRSHNVHQVHNVVVLQLSEQRDFPQSASSINVVVERVLNLLDGDFLLVGVDVLRRTNNAIRALSDRLDRLQT
jgi:hypothetical protein